ncbi:outer membrane lipoprotein carrier protein LolA [Pontiellaceae bacterium B12227]|nr:outer membrane lipoprotein carrier protein LolA [Pontiellaceae bacterium B12227]
MNLSSGLRKLFCLTLLLTISAMGDQEELLQRLEAEFSKIETVQTEFRQEKSLKIFKRVITMNGSITLENPDRMAWRIKSPIRYALVLNGDTAIQWDEDSNKIQKQKTSGDPVFEEIIGQIEKWFSGEFKSLLNDYELTVESAEPPVLRFVPKADSMVGKVINSVTISARADLAYVEKIVIEDRGGDTTSILFFNTVLNEPVPSDAWEVKRDG